MNRKELVKQFTEAVKRMKQTHENGTYHWNLDVYNHNQWAIVLGWADGFEEDPNDECMDGTYRICAKLAFQPTNSMLQCDYDIDWLMPYDENTSEVDDTEISIYPESNLENIIYYLLGQYESYEKLMAA